MDQFLLLSSEVKKPRANGKKYVPVELREKILKEMEKLGKVGRTFKIEK